MAPSRGTMGHADCDPGTERPDSWATVKITGSGVCDGDIVAVEGVDLGGVTRRGEIRGGELVVFDNAGDVMATLPKVERKSPSLGARPPEGAVVIFDGPRTADENETLENPQITEDGLLMEGVATKGRQTSCPRSTSTASDRHRQPGHDKAAGPPDSERIRADTRRTPLQGGKAGGQGKAWCSPGRQKHATHEPLIRRAMLAEVPLAGLSFRWKARGREPLIAVVLDTG